jgi:hypothetical protein
MGRYLRFFGNTPLDFLMESERWQLPPFDQPGAQNTRYHNCA